MNNYCLDCLRPCGCYDYCFRCWDRLKLARSGDFPDEQTSEARQEVK